MCAEDWWTNLAAEGEFTVALPAAVGAAAFEPPWFTSIILRLGAFLSVFGKRGCYVCCCLRLLDARLPLVAFMAAEALGIAPPAALEPLAASWACPCMTAR